MNRQRPTRPPSTNGAENNSRNNQKRTKSPLKYLKTEGSSTIDLSDDEDVDLFANESTLLKAAASKDKVAAMEYQRHLDRLEWIRDKVNYIDQTNWMYKPIEDLLGFKDEKSVQVLPLRRGTKK